MHSCRDRLENTSGLTSVLRLEYTLFIDNLTDLITTYHSLIAGAPNHLLTIPRY